MKRVLVTGSAGFIGRHVVAALRERGDEVMSFERGAPVAQLVVQARGADAVIHLAGVNRPSDPSEFTVGNAELTAALISAVEASARDAVVVLSSSTQAAQNNPYGVSKLAAEQSLQTLAARGGRAVIFRLPNVFGPGARPNYNSVVANFAHNAARAIPLAVHDASRGLVLAYVHDVVASLLYSIDFPPAAGRCERGVVAPIYETTVGELADRFHSFATSRASAALPSVGSLLDRALYATYLSYLPMADLAYNLQVHRDPRGGLAEFLRSPAMGQLFISRTVPGVTRGNHFHHTKTEKFLVVEGDAVVRLRPVAGGPISEHAVNGGDYRVVDIPPEHAHSIENVGSSELVVLFWASEPFDPARPDTYPMHAQAT